MLPAGVEHAQVFDEHHRLDHAGRGEGAVDVHPGEAALAVDDCKGSPPDAPGQVPRSSRHRGRPREALWQRPTAAVSEAAAARRGKRREQRPGALGVQAGPEMESSRRQRDAGPERDHVRAQAACLRGRGAHEAAAARAGEGPAHRCATPAKVPGVEDDDRHQGMSIRCCADLDDGLTDDPDRRGGLGCSGRHDDAIARAPVRGDSERVAPVAGRRGRLGRRRGRVWVRARVELDRRAGRRACHRPGHGGPAAAVDVIRGDQRDRGRDVGRAARAPSPRHRSGCEQRRDRQYGGGARGYAQEGAPTSHGHRLRDPADAIERLPTPSSATRRHRATRMPRFVNSVARISASRD